MPLLKDTFGTTGDGQTVDRYTFSNGNGVTVQIITLGGCITSVRVPDKDGKLADITPGFSTVADYEKNPAYFGALVGRVANRIKCGKFTLDGEEYQLDINNGPNHLHGGIGGFHSKLWSATEDGDALILSRISPDGEDKYPGTLTTSARYELSEENELILTLSATTTAPTLVNLTNHSYWNLSGHDGKPILDHSLQIDASRFTPKCAEYNVPNGEYAPTKGTIYDFTKSKCIGEHIDQCIEGDKGYDVNFCIDGDIGEKRLAARVEHKTTGRYLELFLDKPGMQFYTGGFIDNIKGKDGVNYVQHSSFAIESQGYPDAANKASFPAITLKPGELYVHTIAYKFGIV